MQLAKPSARTVFLLILLFAVSGFPLYQKYRFAQEMEAAAEQEKQHLQVLARKHNPDKAIDIAAFRQKFLSYLDLSHVPSSLHQNVRWHSAEIKRHQQMLGSSQYDLIVLPVEEVTLLHDRVGRLMGARWIADTIEQTTGKRVMPPELAMRLLGGRATRFDDPAVFKLAKRVGADIVSLFLSTPRPWRKKVNFAVVLADSQGVIKNRTYHVLDLDAVGGLLGAAVAAAQPAIGAGLFDDSHALETAKVYDGTSGLEFPDHLTDLVKQAVTPLDHAIHLQLLAILTPVSMDYERRRLFERSLMALRAVDPASSYYNLLMARANAHLFRRPMALSYLGIAGTSAEIALREYLNGNYPQLQAAVPKIQQPLFRMMALVELADLANSYNKPAVDTGQLAVDDPWRKLLLSGIKDNDPWYAPDNVSFFSGLQGLFPEFDAMLVKVIQEQSVGGDFKPFEDNVNLVETVFSRASGNGAAACCPSYSAQLEIGDLWMFYRNQGIANLFRKLNRSVNVHGNYERAQAFAERIEPRFEGHPTFSRLYGQTLERVATKKQGAEKTFLVDRAWELAVATDTNSAAVDVDTIQAKSLKQSLVSQVSTQKKASTKIHYYASSHRELPSGEQAAETYGWGSALNYTNYRLHSLASAYQDGKISEEDFNEQLDSRFNGHPRKPVFAANRLVRAGNSGQAIALLKMEVESGNDSWKIYERLGELLIQASDYGAAGDAYMKYPYFRGVPDGQRVRISNYAYESGSRLFWLGHYDDARSLYELSGSLNTGAESQFASRQRIAMVEQDFRTALSYAYRRGQRYNSIYGYRDYLVYLHLLGFHDEAESGFRGLAPRYESPQLWTSLFVGQRMSKQSFEDISSWAESYLGENNGDNPGIQVQRYLLMQSLVDRIPVVENLDSIAAISIRQPAPGGPAGTKRPLARVFGSYQPPGHSGSVPCKPEAGNCQGRMNTGQVPTVYEGFLQGYLLLKAGKHAKSLEVFRQYDYDHNILQVQSRAGFALPYMMMAAAGTLSPDKLAELFQVAEMHNRDNDFDYELARSVLYATQGKMEAALASLTNAYHQRPHTQWRPVFSWYQLTETAEWLYKTSGDHRFIDKALEWARGYQTIQPQFGWAFAFEALYSENVSERIRAAAFAAYLDADSAWLQQVPDNIQSQGIDWWQDNNPYQPIREKLKQKKPEERSA